ncbi:MAG TPA: ribonuclease P protein component [Steroidobacteraceae bacterium]|nr:ribonuclease P protein component [Steroidobacteraceae bacterium]
MSGAPVRQGFGRQQRLLKASEFEAVYAGRRRVTDSFFAVNFAPNELGRARLGLAIGARAVGNSVARNRIKRLVRESFRLVAAGLSGIDLVVGARNGARTAHNARLRESLDGLWKQIGR